MNQYNIYNSNGRWLCVQSANSESEALEFAHMHGVKDAVYAVDWELLK